MCTYTVLKINVGLCGGTVHGADAVQRAVRYGAVRRKMKGRSKLSVINIKYKENQ